MSRIVLIGCGKAKRPGLCRAEELYTGPLFTDRRAYARQSGDPWWILSGRFGLLTPDALHGPYDEQLASLKPVDRAAWTIRIAQQILDELPDDVRLRSVNVEIHASKIYAADLYDVLLAVGLSASLPVRGLGIGQQRAWYRQRRKRGSS